MKIKVFVHAMDINETGKDILQEQVALIENTGLLGAAEEINMMLHFNEDSFKWLEDRWEDVQHVTYHLFDEGYKEWYEATTMQHIQEMCQLTEDEEDFYVLCMTCKGISHGNQGSHRNWRKYMEYFTVEKWKECVQKLDEGYDLVGAAYLNNPPYPFMPGTFFWAKASYLRKCRRLLPPPEVDFKPQFEGQPHHRFDLECWHGSGNPKWYEMHPGPDGRWYSPPSEYRDDLKGMIVINTAE
jgi:hypothetical protein